MGQENKGNVEQGTYTLVVAEKPSVAQSIAKVIGATGKQDGYLEGNGYLVSWCVGHLVELVAADSYDSRYSKWSLEDLPILPEPWKFAVSKATKAQFDILKKLMMRTDVEELVEATDAGREGELIFRLVYGQAGCRKPFKRLWISSMEDAAVRKGFAELRPGSDYDCLYQAALCRAKADWLVGINGTRLFTVLYGGRTLNVGRVLTPTLAMLAERENAIAGFQKEKYYTVELRFEGVSALSARFGSRTEAEKLRKSCVGKPATVMAAIRHERTEKPPKLYDLTSLQREANRLYGFTAQQTLDYMQLLYEKKLATYPRTDSRYLTEDMAEGIPALCGAAAGAFPYLSGDFEGRVDAARVTDSTKVSDHHAIIPTLGIGDADLQTLPTGERKILAMLAVRLLCAVCLDPYAYAETENMLECAGNVFTAKGRVELRPGWKALERAFLSEYGQKAETGKKNSRGTEKAGEVADRPLPELMEGQTLAGAEAVLKEGTTNPPKRFTEDTLLSSMENAGAEEFAEIEGVERKGLGTPATRAGVIEKLVKGGFAERDGRQLVPTKRGMELIGALPETVKSVKLTAEWEAALKRVERGECPPEEFMEGITAMVRGLVESREGMEPPVGSALAGRERAAVGNCPRCGRPIYEGKKSFYCSGYKADPPCGFALYKENPYFKSKRKELTRAVAAALLKDGRVKMSGLYSEKKGILYDATIVMEDTGERFVNFKLEFPAKNKAEHSK